MPAVMPSAYNVAVPNLDATNRLIVDFGRNPSEFPVLRYSQIVPVKKSTGLCLKMTVEEAGRILNSDLADFVWPDGADAPIGLDNTESFEFVPYRCERYAPHAAVGDLTRDNADWDIVNQNASIKARQAMTARTQMAANRIFTESNYDANNVIDVNATFGAKWNAATTANMVIRKSINAAVQRIVSATLGAVKAKDLVLVLGDTVARAISESQEFADYLKGSPDALGALRYQFRDEPSAANDHLPGVKLVTTRHRFRTLGEKRNASAALVSPDVDAYAVWDDDDIYLPWHLETMAQVFAAGISWSRPAEVWIDRRTHLQRKTTGGLFHGSWGFTREAFLAVGGYPAMQSG
ncbi:hypothetical protein [Thermopirellula anaerolimosa]